LIFRIFRRILVAAVIDDYVRALLAQANCDALPDALAAAGNQRHLIL
jgi:hypothetical protein